MDRPVTRFFKGKGIIAAGSLAAAAILLLCLYGASVFLEGTPGSVVLADGLFRHLFIKGRKTFRMDLSLDLTAGRVLRGRSRMLIKADPGEKVFYFVLNPALAVKEARFEGLEASSCRRFGPLCRVAAPKGADAGGEGLLEVSYSGTLDGRLSLSFFTPDLIYLDPGDCFYPRMASGLMEVNLSVLLPPAFSPVAGKGAAAGAAGKEGAAFSWSLSRRAATFSVAACRGEPRRMKVGSMEVSLYSSGKPGMISRENLLALYAFFEKHLASFKPSSMCFVTASRLPGGRMRSDGADTILFPGGTKINDLAFGFALLWIPPESGKTSLFTREEMAMGWALEFVRSTERLEKARLACLEGIDIKNPLPSIMPRSGPAPGLVRLFHPSVPQPAGGPGYGGFLLSVLRRFVGSDDFDKICRRVLEAPPGAAKASFWEDICRSEGHEGLDWFFRRWAEERKTVDLAVEKLEVRRAADNREGSQVRAVLANLGDLDLPEKVEVVLVTEERWVRRWMVVPRGGAVWAPYVEEGVIGVLVDPDCQWPDADRSNNAAFIDSRPVRLDPSPDNRYLAGAFRREGGGGCVPLVIKDFEKGNRRSFLFDAAVTGLEWIKGGKLLVTTGKIPGGNRRSSPHSDLYLVDAAAGGIRHLGRDILASASPSGGRLLFNELKGGRWRHRLLDLEKKRVSPLLDGIPFRLGFIRGADLIEVERPLQPARKVNLYGTAGSRVFSGIRVGSMELTDFEGYDGGVFFLARGRGEVRFYYLSRPGKIPRLLSSFSGGEVQYRVDRSAGFIFFIERRGERDSFLISRIDLDELGSGVKEVLCKEKIGVPTSFVIPSGFLKFERGGTRLVFESFLNGSEREISAAPKALEILGLVGTPGRRCVYFSREEPLKNIPARWAGFPPFRRFDFFRYDFRSGATKVVSFGGNED